MSNLQLQAEVFLAAARGRHIRVHTHQKWETGSERGGEINATCSARQDARATARGVVSESADGQGVQVVKELGMQERKRDCNIAKGVARL